MLAAKRVLRYLAGTRTLGLTYRGNDTHTATVTVECYSDSDWASNPQDRRSISGYLACLGGTAIDWHSKRQPTVALSSAEAEYVAACFAGVEVVWLRRFIGDIGFTQKKSTQLSIDNQSAIAMIGAKGSEEKRKHISVKYHYVKQLAEKGILSIKWVKSEDNLADIFTKPLGIQPYKSLRNKIMGIQPTS